MRAASVWSNTICLMPTPYDQLLDATIEHLQHLKEQGVRHVPVQAQTLAVLAQGRGPAVAVSAARSVPTNLPIAAPVPIRSTPIAPVQPVAFTAAVTHVAAPKVAIDPQVKAAAMQELRERALACVTCEHLANSRKNVVFGVGDINASLMFVGEAPGAEEDAQGEPFVGAAGQLLTRIIQTMGLSRQTVYIANILKCRPDTPDQASGNRKPTADEMSACIPYLHSQIDLIQPKVLVALGATAVEGLLGKTEGITRLRGKWQTYRGVPLMPTFHPSYLLRNQALSEKRKVWEDMLAVMEHLGMNISEKQQGYFLKG